MSRWDRGLRTARRLAGTAQAQACPRDLNGRHYHRARRHTLETPRHPPPRVILQACIAAAVVVDQAATANVAHGPGAEATATVAALVATTVIAAIAAAIATATAGAGANVHNGQHVEVAMHHPAWIMRPGRSPVVYHITVRLGRQDVDAAARAVHRSNKLPRGSRARRSTRPRLHHLSASSGADLASWLRPALACDRRAKEGSMQLNARRPLPALLRLAPAARRLFPPEISALTLPTSLGPRRHCPHGRLVKCPSLVTGPAVCWRNELRSYLLEIAVALYC